eukprot:1145192-Pelagomonas_calceolata.AAC.6
MHVHALPLPPEERVRSSDDATPSGHHAHPPGPTSRGPPHPTSTTTVPPATARKRKLDMSPSAAVLPPPGSNSGGGVPTPGPGAANASAAAGSSGGGQAQNQLSSAKQRRIESFFKPPPLSGSGGGGGGAGAGGASGGTPAAVSGAAARGDSQRGRHTQGGRSPEDGRTALFLRATHPGCTAVGLPAIGRVCTHGCSRCCRNVREVQRRTLCSEEDCWRTAGLQLIHATVCKGGMEADLNCTLQFRRQFRGLSRLQFAARAVS